MEFLPCTIPPTPNGCRCEYPGEHFYPILPPSLPGGKSKGKGKGNKARRNLGMMDAKDDKSETPAVTAANIDGETVLGAAGGKSKGNKSKNGGSLPDYGFDDDGVLVLPITHPSCRNIIYICPDETPPDVPEWTCPPTSPPVSAPTPSKGKSKGNKSKSGKCSGKITALDLIWDGAQAEVRVTGQQTSSSNGIVSKGQSIKLLNLNGDNDQTITVSDLSGNVIGTSTFHISCSDDDMNSIDDCGKRQGNGKKQRFRPQRMDSRRS